MTCYRACLVGIICVAVGLEMVIFIQMDTDVMHSTYKAIKPKYDQMPQNSSEKKMFGMAQHVLRPEIPILPKRGKMEDRYLFPVVQFDGGPNFQYRQFKIAIQMAVNTSRTIVLTDFRHHRSSAYGTKVSFKETFDIQHFENFIPVITINGFKAKCGSHVDSIIIAPKQGEEARRDAEHAYSVQQKWLKSVGVTIPDSASTSIPHTWLEYNNRTEQLSKADCVVLIAPIGLEKSYFPHKQEVADAMDKYLIRTKFLKKAVKEMIPRLCEGKPMMGFHWRNKTGEQCRIGHLRAENSPRCINLSQVQQQMVKTLLKDIKAIIEQYEIGCMFVSQAPKEDSKDFMDALTSNYSNIITIDDVSSLSHPDIDTYGGDDYFISLIEQEICARSKVFIGNGKSNWSTFIFRERRAFENGPNYDIIKDFKDILDVIQLCF
ncbi:uncharacterized protein LOC144432950 [Glandiceps talaboti]